MRYYPHFAEMRPWEVELLGSRENQNSNPSNLILAGERDIITFILMFIVVILFLI